MNITYSFIIPHKNSPILLNRCILSIPVRSDLEIIVVDDNSSEETKPAISRSGVKLVTLDAKMSKGAGRARNIGISHATGEWLLFPDADDYYEEGFLNTLDQYKDRDYLQIVYFSCRGVDSETLEISHCADGVQKCIEGYDRSVTSLNVVKYMTHAPWCKMIRRKYVLDYGLFYDEVKKGNDVKFSYLSAYFANEIEVIKDRLYVYTFNKQSITHSQRSVTGSLSIRLNEAKRKAFLNYIGLPQMYKGIPFYNTALSVLKHQGLIFFFQFMGMIIFRRKEVFSMEYDYVYALESIKIQSMIKGVKHVGQE
jgi:glycosyltransferase involved in cell wall biosynthesis